MTVKVLQTCIYCGRALNVPTKPAHVFPEALGGRLKSTTTVCDECNNSFSDIEGEVCRRLAGMGALVGARRGDRTHVSTVVEHDGSKWRTEDGRMYELAGPPRDKGRIIPLPARYEDQVATIGAALCSRHLPPEAMLDGRFAIEPEAEALPVEPQQQREPVECNVDWGDAVSKRVMIKIAVELLAYFDSEAARLPEVERARRFARYGDGHEMDFRVGPDTTTNGAGISHVDALWFHGMDVWSSGRKLNYRLVLFSHICLVGTITGNWTGPTISASYTFDFTDPSKQAHAREFRDGATLVNKSRRVRDKENQDAIDEVAKKNFETAIGKRVRAPEPSVEELYPHVKAWMAKRGHKP